jgi:hypothetical protein
VVGEQRVRFRLARQILQTLCSFFGGKKATVMGVKKKQGHSVVNIRWTSYGKLSRLDCDYVVRLGSGKSEVYMTKKRNLVSRRSMNYIILYKFKYAVTRSLKPQWVGEKGFFIL